ncbi:MAG TPA: helix-turn-helix domain-containing protein [Myxococcota bacterium]|nr:helix-turn-helix domain-containing protein [Myxococcota bacterium]
MNDGIRIVDVIDLVAEQCGFTREQILSRHRYQALTRARQWAMHIARDEGRWSFPDIGRAFNRDHTTVMAACGKIAGRVVRNDDREFWRVWDAWQERKQRLTRLPDVVPVRYRVDVESAERVA